jgi:site-specific DNA-methyltransferase (adenine-specific)
MQGDCRELIATLAEESVSSIVTDPPYELGFMSKKWDNSGIAYDVHLWTECLRVLKPGGHLLAFGGTRTYHRMASAIEDAGFEIRDSIHWLYGSGFPKSHDVSKGIDKAAGAERNVVGKLARPGSTSPRISMGDNWQASPDITAPATDAAKQWQGWGTALKPAHEPIVVARKPLVGTVAANVQEYGTGALNIDGARVGDEQITIDTFDNGAKPFGGAVGEPYTSRQSAGRWPANVITDGSIDAEWVRYFYSAKASKAERNAGLETLPEIVKGSNFGNDGAQPHTRDDYKYEGKTRNTHPTVKPLALMRYLVRLVTPPGGIVLEPFAGSGTTLAAAILEGFDAIGFELTADYLPIIEGRIAWAQQERTKAHDSLFGDAV